MHTTKSRGHRPHSSVNAGHSHGRSSFRRTRSRARSGNTFTRSPQHGSSRGRRQPTFNPSQFINTNPVADRAPIYEPKHGFGDFGFTPSIVRTLHALKLATPSPIQDQIIPEIMNGHDVVGIAETGTGKTAAFLLPLIEKTLKSYSRQTLILTPTRELAIQIEQELRKLSAGHKIFSTVCVGGANIRPQIYGLKRQNHFIIGTPGRILDLIERRSFVPSKITTVVLDEADRMLDMGFVHPITKIIGMTPKERETLFFSATMDKRTESLVHDFLRNPIIVSVKKAEVTNSIKQDVVKYSDHDKFDTLVSLFQEARFRRVIIFGSMKHSVEKLARQLAAAGIRAESIHGNKSHAQRQRALSSFKSGHARVLVATDVAARGIHVDNVSHVINYDLPNTFEDYVHRIGRTGRGNQRGEALTFIPAY